jgi:hypothetical protein
MFTQLVRIRISSPAFFNLWSQLSMNPLTINPYHEEWIADWCADHGWTDWFQEQRSYWAFPPHSVMAVPIPSTVLRTIKTERGMSGDERHWTMMAWLGVLLGGVLSYEIASPLPLLLAFAFGAIVAARMEEDEL